jgi:hypothetical protein
MKHALVIGILVLVLAAPVFSQVFPDEETLDVVYVSDGSVIKGKIIEDFKERYVKIEIFGGSTFTVSYEHIDAIEEEPNPDYNTQWIKIEIGDVSGLGAEGTGQGQAGAAEEEKPEREKGPYLGDGSFVSIYGGLALVDYLGGSWEETLDATNARDENGVNATIGVSYAYFQQARPFVAPWWMWGVRTGFAYAPKDLTADIDDPVDGTGTGEYEFRAQVLELPFEFLMGGGGDRLVWYFGGGFGASFLTSEPLSEFDGDDVGHPSGNDADNPVQAFVRGTTGVYFRIGTSDWVGDVRVIYDQILTGSWYNDYNQYYDTWTYAAGIGYRF